MKTAFVSALSGLFLVFQLPALAQGPTYVPGDVLVMLAPGQAPSALVKDLRMVDGRPTGISVVREVSAPMRAWLLHFDASLQPQEVMLRAVRGHRSVQLAQNNHLIEERTVPDDAQYGQQWHHQNINSEGAWEISTGGVTATGDTIVVCIIENADLPHSDLIGNAWFNHGEVPENGQDDDVNGYVDDFLGWDPASGTDNVYGGSHGTQVAGMIGASGNNGIGVVGANWNVKMMVVNYASTQEAAVVAAYTYPWVMRRLYNETNGQKGAFVVATNASWGINGGQPDDSPLWCAMYDSLGTQGVLSCGATANNNVDVDAVGDLPTACSSEYLISVTATNVDDDRTFSAYGLTTIDVGAPGDNVRTTSQGGGYGNTSGTSFASPLTAGVIGLLYSAPCASMMALVHSDPAAGAQYMRDKLFEGVDQVGNLAGQTVTGGRINAGASMQLIMGACGACPGAYNLSVASPTISDAILTWSSPIATTFDLRYRAIGDPDWNLVEGLQTSTYTLTDLTICSAYEYQVRPLCDEEGTEFGNSFTWTSEGCCNAPPGLGLGFYGEDLVNITWMPVLAANTYTVRYREQGTTDWTVIDGITDTFVAIEGLTGCTPYEVQASSLCTQGEGAWSASLQVTTLGCGACLDLTYCTSSGSDSSDEWIGQVSIGTLTNTSGNDGGYGDYTGLSTPLTIGNTYALSLTPAFGSFAFSETWRVFMDIGQDGEMGPEDLLFAPSAASNTTVNGSITIPAGATPGVTRMRVVMKYNTAVGSACGAFNYGETEDYCMELIDGNVGVNEALAGVVRVFPSPADHDLYVDITGVDAQSNWLLTVLDATGRQVTSRPVQNGRATLSTAALAEGPYVYRIANGTNELARGRFLVVHGR
jgi:hypothetical protein